MHGLDTSNVSYRDVTSLVEFGLITCKPKKVLLYNPHLSREFIVTIYTAVATQWHEHMEKWNSPAKGCDPEITINYLVVVMREHNSSSIPCKDHTTSTLHRILAIILTLIISISHPLAGHFHIPCTHDHLHIAIPVYIHIQKALCMLLWQSNTKQSMHETSNGWSQLSFLSSIKHSSLFILYTVVLIQSLYVVWNIATLICKLFSRHSINKDLLYSF